MNHISQFEFNRMVAEQDPERRKGLARRWFSNYVRLIEASYALTKEESEHFANGADEFKKIIVQGLYERAAKALHENNAGLLSLVDFEDGTQKFSFEMNYLASKVSEVKS